MQKKSKINLVNKLWHMVNIMPVDISFVTIFSEYIQSQQSDG